MLVVLVLLVGMPIWALTDARRITDRDERAELIPRALLPAAADPASNRDAEPVWEVSASARSLFPDDPRGSIGPSRIRSAADLDDLAWPRTPRKLPRLDDNPHRQPVISAGGAAKDAICQRLQKLGATYIMLEPVDSTGMVRFHCRMPLPDNPVYERPFQAAAPNAMVAMSDVLKQVQQWVGRRQTRVP